MSHFVVNLYCPDRVLAKGVQADRVYIPSIKGTMQVLPEHTHLVTPLGYGILTIDTGSEKKHYSVCKGLCKVLKNEITLLSQKSLEPSQVNKEELSKEIKWREEKLKGHLPFEPGEFEKLTYDLQVLRTELELASLK